MDEVPDYFNDPPEVDESQRALLDSIASKEQRLLPTVLPQRSLKPVQGTPITQCYSNIDMATMRGKALAVKAGSPGDYEIENGAALKMLATHFIVLPDSQVDEKTGEVSEFVRVVLFDKSGKHFRTSSAHAPFRLKAMLELFDAEQWAAGVPLIVITRPSKRYRGSTYHDILVEVEEMSGS